MPVADANTPQQVGRAAIEMETEEDMVGDRVDDFHAPSLVTSEALR